MDLINGLHAAGLQPLGFCDRCWKPFPIRGSITTCAKCSVRVFRIFLSTRFNCICIWGWPAYRDRSGWLERLECSHYPSLLEATFQEFTITPPIIPNRKT